MNCYVLYTIVFHLPQYVIILLGHEFFIHIQFFYKSVRLDFTFYNIRTFLEGVRQYKVEIRCHSAINNRHLEGLWPGFCKPQEWTHVKVCIPSLSCVSVFMFCCLSPCLVFSILSLVFFHILVWLLGWIVKPQFASSRIWFILFSSPWILVTLSLHGFWLACIPSHSLFLVWSLECFFNFIDGMRGLFPFSWRCYNEW